MELQYLRDSRIKTMEGLIKDTLKKLNKPDFVDSCEVVDSENGLDSEEILLEIGSGMC